MSERLPLFPFASDAKTYDDCPSYESKESELERLEDVMDILTQAAFIIRLSGVGTTNEQGKMLLDLSKRLEKAKTFLRTWYEKHSQPSWLDYPGI